ncbi:class I glutamine amidotransferase-like protein [Macroventuria anomochaeta]|uniref:Class I glutamine amidotransferase-like protein n=1 Tax=Macroventuria anomochaeta TaxID=301207 RepID=A0ACB6RU54_9PLEO|nr:class I glutamine amidotransferase-like protein [Macroventuria anomochaeta]KAF2625247.1 class I glutamine amidotransferase-like protein [Macroventuria anomochaeta]
MLDTFASSTSTTSSTSNINNPLFEVQGDRPVHYGILLFPGFQALDVFGPLDVFNSLAMLYNYPMRLTNLAATPGSVPTHHPSTSSLILANAHPLSRFSENLVVDRTLEEQLDIQEATRHGERSEEAIDVLIVPGGVGVRGDVAQEIEFVRRMYPTLKSVLSVCTGATILARAGILDGRRATTNKRAYKWATSTGLDVKWVAKARWVVDGNIVTSSGISAGIDASYAFVALNYGEDVAESLADSAEYVRWMDPEHDPFSKRWNLS